MENNKKSQESKRKYDKESAIKDEQYLNEIPASKATKLEEDANKNEKRKDALYILIKSFESKDSVVIHKALNEYFDCQERKESSQKWMNDLLVLYNLLYFTEEKTRNYFLLVLMRDTRFLSEEDENPSKIFLHILKSAYKHMGFFLILKFPNMNVTDEHLHLMYQYEYINLLMFTIEKCKKYYFIPRLIHIACFAYSIPDMSKKIADFVNTCYERGHCEYSFKDSNQIFDVLLQINKHTINLEQVKFFITLNAHPTRENLFKLSLWGKKGIVEYLLPFVSNDPVSQVSPPVTNESMPELLPPSPKREQDYT